MPLLDEVLNFKRYQDQQNNAELNALAPAIMSLVQGRQQRQTNLLDQFKLQGELAKSGIGADINMDRGLLHLFQRSDLMNPKDTADIDLKKAQTDLYRNAATGGASLLSGFGIEAGTKEPTPDEIVAGHAKQLGVDPSDLILKPQTRTMRGVPMIINVPELKPALGATETNNVQSLRKVASTLAANMKMIDPSIEKKMSFLNLGAHRGGLANAVSKVNEMAGDKDEPKFATFKAEVDKAFQQYRKETTGAAAALAELGWIAPDLPEASDSKKRFVEKTITAIQRFAEGEKLLLDTYGQRGSRISELKKGSLENTLLKQMQQETGKFEAGERRTKNGVVYVRQDDGTWRKESNAAA